MLDLGTAIGYLMLDTSGFTEGFEKAQKDLDSFKDKSKGAAGHIVGIGSALSDVGGALTTSVTLPLVGAGTAMVKFASDTETAFSQFQAKVGDVTGSMEDYKAVMEDVYRNNYGEDMMDVANAMGLIVTQLGEMDGKELQSVAESAFALRDTFEYDISESIRTVDTLMKNFGLTADEAFDYIVKGQQEGLDYSGEFLDTLNEYSVQFRKLGFDADDMFNILIEGAESGAWNLDKVGDAIKEFSIRVIDGSDTTAEAFQAIGLNADEMYDKFAKGGESAKEAFNETIDALFALEDPMEMNIQGVSLFGTMWEDLGPEVVRQLGDIEGKTLDVTGAMEGLKDVKYNNLEGALGGLARSIQLAGASLGEYFIPYVEEGIEFVNGLVDQFEALDDGTKELIIKIGLVAAAVGPLLLVGGKLITGLGSIIGLLSGAGGITGILSTLSGPVGVAIAAVGLLAAAWATDFDGMREKTSETVGKISEALSELDGTLEGLQQAWDENFLGIQTSTSYILDSIFNAVNTSLDDITMQLGAFGDLFRQDWDSLWQSIEELVPVHTQTIALLTNDGLLNTIMTLVDVGPHFLEEAGNFFSGLPQACQENYEQTEAWFKEHIPWLAYPLEEMGEPFRQAASDAFNHVLQGFQDAWGAIESWIREKTIWLGSQVADWLNIPVRESTGSKGGGFGSHASGLDYVPYNGYKAELHEGERVLTKQENQQYSSKSSPARVYVTVYNTQPIDQNTAKRVSRDIGRETAKELRGRGISIV